MRFEWHVQVRDGKGGRITDAEVALVQAPALAGKEYPFDGVAATHKHVSDGAYEPNAPIAPAAGDWVLIVRRKGSSPVVQKLAFKASGADFTISVRGGAVATADLKSAVTGKGAAAVRSTAFSVRLFPSAEVVFLSGIDYFGSGVTFRFFAEGHAHALFKESAVDAGTRITLFSCDDRARISFSYGPSGQLVQQAIKSFGSASGIKPGQNHPPAVGSDISAVDLYKYLSSVGAAEKGRVREVDIFSHSWPGGPILFNTGDGSSTDARDPNDFDLRDKDFKAANTAGWPNLKDAMAAAGKWQIWGCSATTFHKDMMREARKTKKDDELFDVVTEVAHHNGAKAQRIVARMTRKHVRRMMDARFRSGSYMAAATTFLGISVFGAPPGVGADYSQVDGLSVMGMTPNTPPYLFLSEDFKPEFAPTTGRYDHGYVDYKKMQSRAPPPLPAFDPAVFIFTIDFDDGEATLSLPGAAKQPPAHASANVSIKPSAKGAGFATPGKAGQLYVLEDTDKTKSEAYFLQEDRKVFRVTRDAKHAFTVTAPL